MIALRQTRLDAPKTRGDILWRTTNNFFVELVKKPAPADFIMAMTCVEERERRPKR